MLSEFPGWCRVLVSSLYSSVVGTIEGYRLLQYIYEIILFVLTLLSIMHNNILDPFGRNAKISVRESF